MAMTCNLADDFAISLSKKMLHFLGLCLEDGLFFKDIMSLQSYAHPYNAQKVWVYFRGTLVHHMTFKIVVDVVYIPKYIVT